MARQVAHEVKNPLTPIQLSAEHLRRVYGDPQRRLRADARDLHGRRSSKQVRTLRGIVTEFSAFARPPAPALERRGPRRRCSTRSRALPPACCRRGASLDAGGRRPAAARRGDRRLLERAIVNLIENALQAVGDARQRARARPAASREDASCSRSRTPARASTPRSAAGSSSRSSRPRPPAAASGLALVKKIAEDHGGGVRARERRRAADARELWLPALRGRAPGRLRPRRKPSRTTSSAFARQVVAGQLVRAAQATASASEPARPRPPRQSHR